MHRFFITACKNKKLFTKNNTIMTTQIFVMAIIQCVCVRNPFSTGVENDFYIQIIKINKKVVMVIDNTINFV